MHNKSQWLFFWKTRKFQWYLEFFWIQVKLPPHLFFLGSYESFTVHAIVFLLLSISNFFFSLVIFFFCISISMWKYPDQTSFVGIREREKKSPYRIYAILRMSNKNVCCMRHIQYNFVVTHIFLTKTDNFFQSLKNPIKCDFFHAFAI